MTNAIVDVHADDPEFGYRFIADELERRRPSGERAAGVAAVPRPPGLVDDHEERPSQRRGKTPGPAVHDDLVQRNFRAPALDAVWLTDITEHPTVEGKLYVCAIKDLCSNRIVGYAIDERMTAQLAVNALRSAIARRQPAGTVIVHCDRGVAVPIPSLPGRAHRRAACTGSMGRVAAAGDNAAMESFHALLQKNVLDRRRWRTRAELRYAIITWIEHTYNRRRRQRALGKLTPVEFELALTRRPASKQHDQSQPPSTELAADPTRRRHEVSGRAANVRRHLVYLRESAELGQ